MDLRDIFLGVFWFIAGNLVFYLLYPLFGSFIDGLGTQAIGTFGLTNNIVAIGRRAYIFFWAIVGGVIPIYLWITGASRD